jgi:dTDP-D-glucose 4,6-dehydratase
VRHLVLTYPKHYNVVSFDKLDYCATLNNTRILDDKPNFTFENGDITSPADVKRVFRQHKIDTVFHFAAQSHVDLSFGNSYEFTNTNVYGTHVLLESAREHGITRFIHISTDEVYGDVAVGAADLSETSILAPTNPYSASKAAAEMMVSAYRSSFKLPLITIRANNVYGPHQFPESMWNVLEIQPRLTWPRNHTKIHHAATAKTEAPPSRRWIPDATVPLRWRHRGRA